MEGVSLLKAYFVLSLFSKIGKRYKINSRNVAIKEVLVSLPNSITVGEANIIYKNIVCKFLLRRVARFSES